MNKEDRQMSLAFFLTALVPIFLLARDLKHIIVKWAFIQKIMFIGRKIAQFAQKSLKWAIIIIIAIIILKIVLWLINAHKKRREQKEEERNEIKEFFHNKIKYFEKGGDIEKQKKEFDKKINKLRVPEKYSEEIKKAIIDYKFFKYRIEEHHKKIRKERIKQENKEKKKKARKEEEINKLTKYFTKQDDDYVIPEWAKNYETNMIREATKKYYKIKEQKELQEQAEEFVRKNKGLPRNYTIMEEKEKKAYNKAIKKLKKGTLKTEETIKEEESTEEEKKLKEKKFYLTSELNVKEREVLIKKFGYKNKLSMKTNVLILNDETNEGDDHFIKKHLLARINSKNSIIEYTKRGKRADVVFKKGERLMAVEIETGKNNAKQIDTKAKWLNNNFNKWIILAPRDKIKKYKKYVNNKKSYCLTYKDTKEKIKEFLEN